MKKIGLYLIFLVSVLNADIKYFKEIISTMQPNTVFYEDKILYVKMLKTNRVNMDIANTIIKAAYCGDIWLNGKESFLKSFSGIKGLVILNKNGYQSIIYKGNEIDCIKIGDMVGKIANMEIASKMIFATGSNLEKEIIELKRQ